MTCTPTPSCRGPRHRTTDLVAERLEAAGVTVNRLRDTGLLAEIGDSGPLVGLRADLDALPVDDTTGLAVDQHHARGGPRLWS